MGWPYENGKTGDSTDQLSNPPQLEPGAFRIGAMLDRCRNVTSSMREPFSCCE